MTPMKSALTFAFTMTCCLGSANAEAVFPIATNSNLIEFGGRVAFDGTNYLASLIAGTNVSAQRISPNGELVGSPLVAGANPGFPPASALASAASISLAVWTDYSVASGVTMFGRLVSGNSLGSSFPLLAAAGGHGTQAIQAAASDGTNFLAVWRDNSTGSYYGQRVSAAGGLSGTEFLLFTTSSEEDRNMALTFGRTNYLIAWQDGTDGENQVHCKLISTAGAVGSAFQVNTTPSVAVNPAAIGFDGTNYLVVWSHASSEDDGGSPEWNLYGRLVSQSGVPLGNELALVTERASFPAVAFDGANYLLAWGYNTVTTNADRTIHAQFFNASGNPLGPIITPFSAQGANAPLLPIDGLLFDGQRFLLTATFGSFVVGPTGDVMGFTGGDVYGRFLPRSTASPVFTNATVAGGHFQGQLLVTPGMTYTIEISTNLQN